MKSTRSSALTALAALCLAASAPAWAVPGLFGLRGLPSTIDARATAAGTGSASTWLLYQSAGVTDTLQFSPPLVPSVDTLLAVEDTEHYLDASIQIGYGITDRIEAAVIINSQLSGFEYDQVFPRGDHVGFSDIAWGFSEAVVSGKYSYPVREDMTAAGIVHVSVPFGEAFPDTCADYDGYWNEYDLMTQVRRPYIGTGGICYGLTGAFTAESRYVTGHANAGVTMWSQKTTVDDEEITQSDMSIDFSIGGEAPTPLAVFFLSVSGRMFPGRSSDPGYSMPMWADLGMRITESSSGAWMDLMGRVGFSSYDRDEASQDTVNAMPIPQGLPGDFGVMLCLGYDLALLETDGGSGTITGTVRDASTGDPLSATVSFPGVTASPVQSDPATGAYTAVVPAGDVPVVAEAAGFTSGQASVRVERDGTASADFDLAPAQAAQSTGTVTGVVTDEATRAAISATVTETSSGAAATAGPDGTFTLTAPSGSRVVKAEAPGYIAETQTVIVPENGAVSASFSLGKALESGQVLTFANIYFDSGSATLKAESYPVLNEIAELLIANQGVSVQVCGHTDSDGSESLNQSLSERRAASVKTYLVSRGVGASYLSTIGYGESSPVAPNTTPEGKAQNRRIEFRVL